ncbi:MAG: TetR/AcrR family transcriptional regulator [Proteobacteria bacterium]|nr:TetR/AcrR family transcriptional regulator [Pseudomonadota bacterium]
MSELQPAVSADGASGTAERILDAAEALFAERGLAGTAVRDIAARVSLNPASLYNHFPSKQALYEAVLERGVQPLIQVVAETTASRSDPEIGDQAIEALMAHLKRTPHLPRLIQHEAVTGGEHLARLARRWIRPLTSEALARLKEAETGWEEDEFPNLIAAWMNLVFGHFAMAPLLEEVFEEDPLSDESLARQTRFLRKLTRQIIPNPR